MVPGAILWEGVLLSIVANQEEFEDSAKALVDFLSDLELVLDDVASDPGGLIPDSLRADLQQAWEQVRPLFDPAREVVEVIPATAALQGAGLTGHQLKFKLGGAYRAKEQHDAFRAPGSLRRFLGWADNILGSLPIPREIKEPIEDYTSAVELAAEDSAQSVMLRRPFSDVPV